MVRTIANLYRIYFSRRGFVLSVILAFALLFFSFWVNFYAGVYATERASNAVNDIVLNNIPVFDVDIIFVYGPFLLWFFVALITLADPKKIPFLLKSIATFILIRSLFITLTHIGPFPDHLIIPSTAEIFRKFTFGGDLFFSAHTGLPFLMALVFGQNDKKLRILFTLVAVLFGVVVLLGHLHYSIDVLAAFFITFTIFHIAVKLFPRDRELFLGTPNSA